MLDDSDLSAPVAAALRLAATNRPNRCPLTTGRVLSALIQVDIANNWQRIWLHVGDPIVLGLADEPDDPVELNAAGIRSSGREPELWQGVPLSQALADALRLMERICRGYRLMPAPGGALALALLANPANGAARALLRSGALEHAKLLELVQSELLGTTLEGIGRVIANGQPAGRAPALTATEPPSGDWGATQAAPAAPAV